MTGRSIVDTHVHLWDLAQPDLIWNWVDTADDHPLLGPIDAVKMRAFEMQDLWGEARFAGVESFVHVQAAIGSSDPVAETRWLAAMAQDNPRLQAVVGHVDLSSEDAVDVLDAHQEFALFRGVRDFAVEPYLASGEVDSSLESSLQLLAERGLLLDLDCEYHNMQAARGMAERHPDLQVVLEHFGFPRSRDADYFARWRAGIRQLAQAPNTVCKLSGLGMTDRRFTTESLLPWVEVALEAFGPDRCMVGSNWPLDRLCSSYDALMQTVRALVGELSAAEQDAVLHGSAARVYGLPSLPV